MNRIPCVLMGIVKDVHDPDKLGRVQVLVPDLDPSSPTVWARVVRSFGVPNGAWIIPQLGDEVLVAFEAGDVRRPFILGGLWNQRDQPPTEERP
jgi:uncharacterized protein involved in type VI secretion and phage assembly